MNNTIKFPSRWSTIMGILAVTKAMIAGVGIGLAAMGALDIAFAVTAAHWWAEMRPDWILNAFAGFGALGAVVARIVS